MEYRILSELGLTRNEIKVFCSLLEHGSSLAGDITQRTGIHRRNVYDALERLTEKGLVSSVTINNRNWFKASPPKRLLGIVEERKQALDRTKGELSSIIPKFEKLAESHVKRKSEIMYFKGIEGLKTVYDDILNESRDYMGYGPGGKEHKLLKHYMTRFMQEKEKRKIHCKIVYNEGSRDIPLSKLTKARYIPEVYNSPVSVRIYGEKVAIMLLDLEEPFAIVIKNKKLADGYRKRFNFTWSSAKT